MQAFFEKISAAGQSFVVRERVDPVLDFRWHFHPEFELTYIVQSSGQRFVGDSIERYRDGDVVLLGANLPHTWMSETDSVRRRHRALYAQFLGDFGGEQFLSKPELAGISRVLDRASQGLRFGGKT